LPLGIDDYKTLLHALQAGFGLEDRDALVRLCCVLWAKSPDEVELTRSHFAQVIQSDNLKETSIEQVEVVPEEPQEPLQVEQPPVDDPQPDEEFSETDRFESSHLVKQLEDQDTDRYSGEELDQDGDAQITTSRPPQFVLEVEDEIQVAQAVQATGWEDEVITSRFLMTSDYLPITRRQMKRSWRYLRRMVREGPPTELDIEATITMVAQRGVLLEPVLVPRRINRTELLLLLDQNGSMVPFHMLSRRLAETALRGGRLGRANIYYFHNCPVNSLYSDPYRLNAVSVEDVLKQVHYRHVRVLIFSDAGAARGGFSPERLELTDVFIEKLKQDVQYIAWLNPMPCSRWSGTTAGEVADMVPMFEMSRHGMDKAIRVLLGRSTQSERSVG
jgi:hypothetical protein